MTGVPMTQAGLRAPLLAFPTDDDVFPFEDVGHLIRKSGWLVSEDRHVGVEIVDSAERRWVISGLVQGEPEKRRWWQFGRASEPQWEIEIEPRDPEPFAVTRQRVADQASRIFAEGDDALADIRAAATMADLSRACFEITLRAQGLRILAGDQAVPLRTPLDVARRAIILFAFVRLALGIDRRAAITGMDEALLAAVSPSEAALLAERRWTEEQLGEAGWNIEGLVALLWALDLADMPAAGELIDAEAIGEIVPPTADTSCQSFLQAATLRPAMEIAAAAERFWAETRSAADDYAAEGPERAANIARSSYLRYGALIWVLNPGRLNWE